MNQDNSNLYFKTQNELNLKQSVSQNPTTSINLNQSTPQVEHDEPGLYHGLGTISFATATLLLGISNWDGYDNKKLLTIYGFFIGGLGQYICGILCYKYKYYIDGTVYFYFALNWSISACYDLFPLWGWMEPLGKKEWGYQNLMGCFFTLVFCLQNLGAPSILTRISFTTTFLGFVSSTISGFTGNVEMRKVAGIFNIITAALAYYSAFAMTINERYKKIWMPVMDGKKFGLKLD